MDLGSRFFVPICFDNLRRLSKVTEKFEVAYIIQTGPSTSQLCNHYGKKILISHPRLASRLVSISFLEHRVHDIFSNSSSESTNERYADLWLGNRRDDDHPRVCYCMIMYQEMGRI